MSSDDYYMVFNHPSGAGYCAVVGHGGHQPAPSAEDRKFDTLRMAFEWAERQEAEYGTQIHDEVEWVPLRDDESVEVPVELIADFVYAWQCWERDSHPLGQARHLIELANRVSDIQSYHPGYDIETGTMPWDRDEDETDG